MKNGQVSTAAMRSKQEKVTFRKTNTSIKDVRRAIKLGHKHASDEEWAEAVKHLVIAWDAMPDDISILTLLAHSLVQLGVRDHALAVLERALRVNEPTVELIDVIQRLALDMGFFDIAIKLCAQLIQMAPRVPGYYVQMATAYSSLGRYDESINMLQAAIPLFPESADLWNVLATQVRERDGLDAADVFFEEALRLDPNNYKVINNYSISFTRRNQFDKALELALRATEHNKDLPDPHIGAALLLFMKGEMQEAWKHYAYRQDVRRRANQSQIYTHKLDQWQGEPLKDKTIFVTAEQGIGDEVMWGSYLPHIYKEAKKLIIGCDPRLVSIYQRRFPDAIVARYADKIMSGYRYRSFPDVEYKMKSGDLDIDYYIPVASIASFAWHTSDDIRPPSDGYLTPCPQLTETFKEKLGSISHKPKIGIAWRSGLMTSSRNYLYASIEALGPIFALSDKVDFINVQYGDVANELALAEKLHGVKIHDFPDVDLKADIEANLAIMSECDLVISSCSAPGMFAMSVGTPTLLMSGSTPWWQFGHDNIVPFAADAEIITNTGDTDWEDIVLRLSERVNQRLASL
ncbi:tetratricopeptide repeat protein [Kordiimonas aquimaris]|uniref:tetratricopeptide repeat protein n=1 Tax=Kordiimonas aquimaris TaxID=707591 RepID=UPI0021D2AA9F|nr:tetratricopeptide repeat protein [Kordiimonas aquimaris]